MLINLSNHPSARWSDIQLRAAIEQFGEVIDLPFPEVQPACDENQIASLADEYVERVAEIADASVAAVHVMGEMTLTYSIVNKLKSLNYSCVASTTERVVEQTSPSTKESTFRFVRFRNY